MADISMCLNEQCPSKDLCYRFTAWASPRQAYMDFKPEEGQDKCKDYRMNDKAEELQNGIK